MDIGQDERARAPLHGVVSRATAARAAFGATVAAALAAAVAGGLWRAGLGASVLPAQAGLVHGPMMLSAFLGTVIGLERAVALRRGWGFAAPLLSAAGGVALLAGAMDAADALGLAGMGMFLVVSLALVRRQPAAHTVLLAVAAGAAVVAQALHAQGWSAAWRWWLLFPVLTIAAERLELTRLARRHAAAEPALLAIVVVLLAGAALGPAPYGLGLLALSAWLFAFDIARRTVRTEGLSRFIAVCLLAGYAWLAFAGVAWIGIAYGCPGQDAALHAIGLGFVMSMVMGHAPVMLPVLARVKLAWHPVLYAPLALLHGSLLWRFGPSLAVGAALNAAALAAYAAVVVARRQR